MLQPRGLSISTRQGGLCVRCGVCFMQPCRFKLMCVLVVGLPGDFQQSVVPLPLQT